MRLGRHGPSDRRREGKGWLGNGYRLHGPPLWSSGDNLKLADYQGLGLWQLLAFAIFLALLTKPLGSYMADIFEGRRTLLSRFLIPVERLIYRLCGIDAGLQQEWTNYAASCLAFSLVSALFFYAQLRLQGILPLNPQGLGTPSAPPGATPMTPDLAFNIATSFMTNTSWQAWAGETTLSYLSQMLGIAVQSFTSAAAGMAVAVALIRSLARQESDRLGNFWVDVTRSVLYILLPLALVQFWLRPKVGEVLTGYL
jgi:K+-transporting ATPase ATPase A chain